VGTLDLPTSGTIVVAGEDITTLGATRARKLAALRNRTIGFVFQFHHLLPEFTALENVAMPGLIQGKSPREMEGAAAALLKEVGSGSADASTGRAVGGEQQRVTLARSATLEPKPTADDRQPRHRDERSDESRHQSKEERRSSS
jgi:lipoprotein-releasing system ATP-binding protein